MILQAMDFFSVLAQIFGAILTVLKPIVQPIGAWMVSWITTVMDFLYQNFGDSLNLYLVIFIVLVISGIFINIIWPGDRKGSIFSASIEKVEKFEDKIEEKDEDITEDVRRCKDCGNPIGDQDVCPLCGARN